VTFGVGVTPASVTGSVAIIDNADQTAGGTASGPQNNGQFAIPLSGGAGSEQYNGLPGGTYSVSARYGGDTANSASTSNSISVTIAPEASTTALEVNAYSALTGKAISGTSYPYGSEIVMDATVFGTAEGANNTEGVATGSVTFKNGSGTLGSASVNSNDLASWPPFSAYTVLAPATYSVTASYGGDASFNASTSTAAGFTVSQAATSTAASASTSSITSGQSVTINITMTTAYNLSAQGLGSAPTGTVTLSGNGNNSLGAVNLSSFSESVQSASPYNIVFTGTATIQGIALASGSNTINLAYSGDNNYAGSSATTAVTVTGAQPGTIALTNSGNVTVNGGATTGNTSIITVTPSGGLTGQVNLSCAVTTSLSNPTSPATCSVPASVTISGTTAQTATLSVNTTTTTTAGAYTVTVTGTSNSTPSITSSTQVMATVNASLQLSSSGNITLNPGATTGNTATITIAPTGGFTGNVSLSCSVSPANLSDTPSCSVPSSVTVSGAGSVTATLTITTTPSTSAELDPPLNRFFLGGGGTMLTFVAIFWAPLRRRGWRNLLVMLALLVALGSCALACGGGGGSNNGGGSSGGNPGTAAGNYTVTVMGSGAGNVTGSVQVTLDVQ
jgi:trimeric autotransporter adhesin